MTVTEDHVLRVLAGAPASDVAAHAQISQTALASAVAAYRAAGRHALAEIPRWLQIRIRFTGWDDAEPTMADHIAPHLNRLAPVVARWWFIRKYPNWRVRFLPAAGLDVADLRTALTPALDSLATDGRISRWWESRYEPEDLVFGGPPGMSVAHDLFHIDSAQLLRHRYALRGAAAGNAPESGERSENSDTTGRVGRKEMSVLLCSALARSARQDAHEQADIWDRVARARTTDPEPGHQSDRADRADAVARQLHQLITADVSPGSALLGDNGPLQFAAGWIDAFTLAGQQLADLARDGDLTRGIRAVLADHVIFHWNRLGFTVGEQALLAQAARDALLPTRPGR